MLYPNQTSTHYFLFNVFFNSEENYIILLFKNDNSSEYVGFQHWKRCDNLWKELSYIQL